MYVLDFPSSGCPPAAQKKYLYFWKDLSIRVRLSRTAGVSLYTVRGLCPSETAEQGPEGRWDHVCCCQLRT